MSAEAVREVLTKAAGDDGFRALLASDSTAALAQQRQHLTRQEREWLAAAPDGVLQAMSAPVPDVPADSDPATRPLVKELGAIVLTAVLVVVFGAVLEQALRTVDTDPRGVQVGHAMQLVSPFTNAKDLLGIVLPLFGAAVTFWLGAAIEGRRADANGKAADQASSERDVAKQRERQTRTTGVQALGVVELRASGAAPVAAVEPVEGRTPRSPGATRTATSDGLDLDGLANILSQAQRHPQGIGAMTPLSLTSGTRCSQ